MEWNSLRVFAYYLFVWICILLAMIIYIGIGAYVFRARNKLHQMAGSGRSNIRFMSSCPTSNHTDQDQVCSFDIILIIPMLSLAVFCESACYGMYCLLIHIEDLQQPSISLPQASGRATGEVGVVNVTTELEIEGCLSGERPENPSPISRPEKVFSPLTQSLAVNPAASGPETTTSVTVPAQYCRRRSALGSLASITSAVRDHFFIVDPVKRAYLRTCLLFGASVMVTWIPSSVNRIHSLIYNDSPFPYNAAAATVLPLQGVWNGLIFFITSWKVFRQCVRELTGRVTQANGSRASQPPRARDRATEEETIEHRGRVSAERETGSEALSSRARGATPTPAGIPIQLEDVNPRL